MRTELYHYAISLNGKNLSAIPTFCIWFLLFVFLVPILISKIWVGLGIFSLYIVLYFCIKNEDNKNNKALLNFGIFLLFLGLEFSVLLIMQYKVLQELIITTCTFVVVYEIVFAIKIKQKIYSQKPKVQKRWVKLLPLICGGTGVWCGKLLANNVENTDFKLWIAIPLCSILIVGAVSFFQKMITYKIIKKTGFNI